MNTIIKTVLLMSLFSSLTTLANDRIVRFKADNANYTVAISIEKANHPKIEGTLRDGLLDVAVPQKFEIQAMNLAAQSANPVKVTVSATNVDGLNDKIEMSLKDFLIRIKQKQPIKLGFIDDSGKEESVVISVETNQ